jgi:leucine-rich PPR motif-containing protein
LEKEVEEVRPDNAQSVKDKFPRGGAMGLLENNPDLVEKYSKVAHKFIELDYIAPMNVLWTYHFINGRHAEADPLWEKYVRDCPQIMFQKICQTARSRGSLDMASRLVDLLQDARVTSGAQGIAYSCLLDVMTQAGDYRAALHKLEAGMRNGVRLDDVNRTALVRLKGGLEKVGAEFPYEIPKKCNNDGSNMERSLSPMSM